MALADYLMLFAMMALVHAVRVSPVIYDGGKQ
jgi:hypothetical protein